MGDGKQIMSKMSVYANVWLLIAKHVGKRPSKRLGVAPFPRWIEQGREKSPTSGWVSDGQ
jgi:hypothetical protein